MSSIFTISDELWLELPFQLTTLIELKFERRFNQHVLASLNGYITEACEETVLQLAEDDKVKLYLKSNNEERLIFQGIPSDFQLVHHTQTEIHLKIVSISVQMDREKKTRSFQRNNSRYEDIINEIIKEYQGDFMNRDSKTEICEIPLIQYQETDWEFMKRISAICKKPIYPTSIDSVPKIYLGCNKKTEESVPEDMERKLCEHLRFHGHDNTKYPDVTFKSKAFYELGQAITYKDKIYYVSCVNAELINGGLLFAYRFQLEDEGAFYDTEPFHLKRAGRMIFGKILDVKTNKVKLHLNIDNEQNSENAYWYSWYRNDWYCMPEKGTEAALYLPENDERKAYVTAINWTDQDECSKIKDPNTKYFTTSEGKEWKFNENSITLQSLESDMYIQLSDDAGITVVSNENIILHAGKSAELTGSKIKIKGKEKIWLSTRETSIVMDEVIQIKG